MSNYNLLSFNPTVIYFEHTRLYSVYLVLKITDKELSFLSFCLLTHYEICRRIKKQHKFVALFSSTVKVILMFDHEFGIDFAQFDNVYNYNIGINH